MTYCFKIKLRFFVFQVNITPASPRWLFYLQDSDLNLKLYRCKKSFQHLPLQQPIWFNVAPCLAMYCLFAITILRGLMAFHGSEGCGNIAVPEEIEALPENLAMWQSPVTKLFNIWSNCWDPRLLAVHVELRHTSKNQTKPNS